VKKFFAALALAILSGCALFTPYQAPVSQKAPVVCEAVTAEGAKTACAEAGDVLIKAYVTLAAVNQDIKETAPTGVWTKAQAQGYLDRSKDARQRLDKAWTIFAAGDYQSALSQANITTTLLVALEKEVATQAAKGQK
jgi:hypothetical protein